MIIMLCIIYCFYFFKVFFGGNIWGFFYFFDYREMILGVCFFCYLFRF